MQRFASVSYTHLMRVDRRERGRRGHLENRLRQELRRSGSRQRGVPQADTLSLIHISIATAEVYLEVQSALKPGIFRALEPENFLYLVMPVRIS